MITWKDLDLPPINLISLGSDPAQKERQEILEIIQSKIDHFGDDSIQAHPLLEIYHQIASRR